MIWRVLPLAVPEAGAGGAAGARRSQSSVVRVFDELRQEIIRGRKAMQRRRRAPRSLTLDDELDDEDAGRQHEMYWYCRTMIGTPHCPCWTNSPECSGSPGRIVNVLISPELALRYWAELPDCQFTRSALVSLNPLTADGWACRIRLAFESYWNTCTTGWGAPEDELELDPTC